MTKITSAADRWKQHLARDRERSAEARRVARQSGRPSGHQVSAAICQALQDVWAANVDRIAGPDDIDARKLATGQPIAAYAVAEAAVAILVNDKRCDHDLAARAVMERIRPRRPLTLRVPKSAEPLKAPMTSYR